MKINKLLTKFTVATLASGLLLSAPLASSAPTYAASKKVKKTSNKKKTTLRQYTKNTMAKYHLRGSMIVVKDGKAQQVSYGYGYYRRRIGAGSSKLVYPLGSLQKSITATMITQLIYKGKFSQNTKISRWYPNLKNASRISVGNLMTHTSGITVVGTEVNNGINFSENGALNWIINKINSQSEQRPGKFNYNNANYILLAGIIRKTTGKSYASNLKSRIIKPLNLKQTYMYNQIPKGKTDAISYTYRYGRNYQDPQYAPQGLTTQLLGAGDVFSSPKDYYKILVGMQNGKILTKKQFKYMTHLKAKAKDTTYSGGLYMRRGGKLEMAYGNFGDTHFANWIQLTSDNQNGIVMFLNQTQDKNKNKDAGYRVLKKIKFNTFVNR